MSKFRFWLDFLIVPFCLFSRVPSCSEEPVPIFKNGFQIDEWRLILRPRLRLANCCSLAPPFFSFKRLACVPFLPYFFDANDGIIISP